MKIFPRTGRIPISLTIATTFVGLVVVLLGSVLTVSYFSSLRNTLDRIGELVIQSSSFVEDELRDHLDPVGAAPVKWSTHWDRNIPISGGPENGWKARQA